METQFELGTVIHATLRPQDLVPAFLERLHSLEPETHARLLTDFRCIALSDDDPWWDSEDCAHFLNEDLFDALNNCAPDYVYFGSHEGDGSDFGFWINWEAIEEAIHDGELPQVNDRAKGGKGTHSPHYVGMWIHINDHGNATLYNRIRGGFGESGKDTIIWTVV